MSSFLLFRESRFGGAKRLYYLAKELEKYHEVYTICFDGCSEFQDYNTGTKLRNSLALALHVDPSIFRKIMYGPANFFYSIKRNAEEISGFIASGKPEIGIVCFSNALSMTPLLRPFFKGKRLVYLEDDLLLREARNRMYQRIEDANSLFHFPFSVYRYLGLRLFYMKRLKHFRKYVCISEAEAAQVRRFHPSVSTFISRYGIPVDEYPFKTDLTGIENLGFIGNFAHQPNTDAVKWFISEVWSDVSVRPNGLRVRIAGKNIGSEMRKLCSTGLNVDLLGEVESLEEFYRKIDVFFNPIVSGGGLRTKVVEAAAFGVPVISTHLGAEGLDDFKIPHFWDADSFLRCLKEISPSSKVQSQILHNRKIVEQRFSVSSVGREFCNMLEETFPRLES